MTSNKVYVRFMISGISRTQTEAFSVSSQSDAKKMIESKYSGKKISYLSVVGPTSSAPIWHKE